MQYTIALISTLATLPAAYCVAFGGPAPTNTSPNRELKGWTPKPTNGPSVAELRKRQTNLDPGNCGWVNGIVSSAVSCPGLDQTCMLYTTASGGTTAGMAGCCTAGDTQNCGWAYSCVDYSGYSTCDSSCKADNFVRKCAATAPYCITWVYAADSVFDFGCGTDAFDTIQTIYEEAISGAYTTSMTLPTISNNAISFADLASAAQSSVTNKGASTYVVGTSTSTLPQQTPTFNNGGGNNTKPKKKVSTSVIVGAVVGALVLLFVIGVAIVFVCLKQKKNKQLAANQATIAAAQANRPQSSFPPQNQPPMMQQAPPPAQQPQNPEHAGYFAQPVDHKINHQTQVHEYGAQSPISQPATPAPPYVQPYYANAPMVPPLPVQSPAPAPPANGAHEVDSISVAHVPGQQPGQALYEIGGSEGRK